MSDDESMGTVLTALFANLVIAVAKIVAGLLSGSSAMLAEGAHSVADTTNQVFLLTALRLSRRPADETHPFGYGKERFFWSLLAAVGIFVSGAAFSIYEGVHNLLSPTESETRYVVAYAVLGISFVFEGISFLRAWRQLRTEARRAERDVLDHVLLTSDPTVKTVFSEDAAALVGLVLAAAGLALHQVTGKAYWDAGAAITIGLLLAVVAYLLGRDNKELLIGEAAPPPVREALRQALESYDGIRRVIDLRTMLVGPDAVLVASHVDVDDSLTGAQVEELTDRIADDLRARLPEIREVYLDATAAPAQVAASTPAVSSSSTSPPRATR